jgi:hypothetical protein
MTAPEPDPWAEGNYRPHADPLSPDLADSLVSWYATHAAASPSADEPVPYTLTGQAEAALDAEPEPLPDPDPDPEVGGWPGWSDRSMLAPDPEPEIEP